MSRAVDNEDRQTLPRSDRTGRNKPTYIVISYFLILGWIYKPGWKIKAEYVYFDENDQEEDPVKTCEHTSSTWISDNIIYTCLSLNIYIHQNHTDTHVRQTSYPCLVYHPPPHTRAMTSTYLSTSI